MDVLLLKPYSDIFNVVAPLGLGYLAAALKKEGISSRIINLNKDRFTIPELADFIKREKISVVGVSCCSNEHSWLEDFSRILEYLPEVSLVAGGPHPTGLSKRLMELIPRINFIIRAEAEESLPQLVRILINRRTDDFSLSNIANLVWRDNSGSLIENTLRFPDNLDALEFPDWNALSPADYSRFSPHGGFRKSLPVAQIITTRGCPCACRYCAAELMNGKALRKRSCRSVLSEIDYLVNKHNVKEIHIEDDNFTFDKNHALGICRAIQKSGYKLYFGLPNGIRLDRFDEEVLKELKNTGFYFFSLGIESGSPATLKKMGKFIDLDKVKSALSLMRRYDFIIKGFFIIGYPGETKKDIFKTIEFAKSLDLDQAFFSFYIPFPGTPEFSRLEAEGKIDTTSCNWDNFYSGKFTKPPYIPEGINEQELKKMLALAFRSFYFRPKIAVRLVKDFHSFVHVKSVFRAVLSLMSKA
ncbi:MAG: radical SAM protein [Candidatus Omnitrophica bacterium]|nr:radical SAM protein [Candidatus Omnitrophota bacterium]